VQPVQRLRRSEELLSRAGLLWIDLRNSLLREALLCTML
jgi:hypothetical protein